MSEIINIKVPAGSRTIYLDMKEQEDGSRFLSIHEVKHGGDAAGTSRVIVDQKYRTEKGSGVVVAPPCPARPNRWNDCGLIVLPAMRNTDRTPKAGRLRLRY